MTNGPVLLDLDEASEMTPENAPPVPDMDMVETPAAMQRVASLAAARPNRLARWFWGLLVSLVGFFVGLFCAVLMLITLRELAAFARLRRVDRIQNSAADALAEDNLKGARAVTAQIKALYRNRDDTSWGRSEFDDRSGDIIDADGLLGLAETTILAPLDARARLEVEAAARQVATVTAIVPLALADVFTALRSNMRMIRRIAEVYGGRSGTLGSWSLTRQVLAHLVATRLWPWATI